MILGFFEIWGNRVMFYFYSKILFFNSVVKIIK